VLLAVAEKAFGRATKRFVPRGWSQNTVIANEWLGEPGVILLSLSGHMPASGILP
jgi:hypothetical protein